MAVGVAASDSYLENLNEAQQRAVMFDHKKALQIIAGPGTGKTKVLTARFAYLVLQKGIQAEDIVMTTFTRKAAEEMKERLLPVLVSHGISPHGLKIGTFHSICWKLLKEKGFLIGREKIERATTEKIKSVLEEIIVEMPDQIRDYATTKSYRNSVSLCRIKNNQWQVHPDMILKRISELKADAMTPEKYGQQAVFDEALLHFYQQYQAKLSKENLIDFDDVMLYSFELLSKHRVWKNIKHVLVDEFQDTNLLQINLIFQLARGSHHSCEGVTVVGDPDQGIYGFRSALSHNFQTMIELCPIQYDQIVLTENYRSAQAILDISETVIKQQKNGRDNREPLRAQFVTDRKIAAALEKERAEEKTQTAFGFLQNIARGNVQLNLNSSSLIGIKEYVKTIEQLRKIFSVINSDASKETLADSFEKIYTLSGLKSQYAPNNESEMDLEGKESGKEIHRHRNIINVKNYFSTFKIPAAEDGKSRDVVPLIEFCREFVSFTDLYTFKEDNDSNDHNDSKEDHLSKDAVVLSTIHASKGLEWPVVFVPQCVEGLLPSYYKDVNEMQSVDEESDEEIQSLAVGNDGNESQDEGAENAITSSPSKKKTRTTFSEERRMFFVALTRAKYFLYITTVEKEATIFKSRFLKNEVIELCDETLTCFESIEQLFKLYYTMKVKIPNQDRISYEQLIQDYNNYGSNNRQLIFWKDKKYSHVDLPNTTENTVGIATKKNEVKSSLPYSALPRVNRKRQTKEQTEPLRRPADIIVNQNNTTDRFVADIPNNASIVPSLSPTKTRLTREETRELDVLLSDNEFLPEAPIKSEVDYTAAEILHNKEESVVDNRPILTSARILASAIKQELSQSLPNVDLSSTESQASNIKEEDSVSHFKGKVPKNPREQSTNSKTSSASSSQNKAKKTPRTGSVKKKSKKSNTTKVKLEHKPTNDILFRLERAKQRKEEWDGEIIDLRSSQ
ncbi:hypothetical protein C6P41_003921 [Kluyveromyces marxianus]|nr:hypothetical protein C6P41_003921 [Kluyveromyces marxianus]